MADSSSSATFKTSKATSTANPPVQDIQQTEPEVDQSSMIGERAVKVIGGGSPETPPDRFSEALGQGSAPQVTGMLRQLQRSYGNSYVGRVIQRKCDCGGTCASCEEKKLQRKGEGVVSAIPAGFEAGKQRSGAGNALDMGTRSFMKPRFGKDFSDVRVHTDESAVESARLIQAQAFTTGRDIYFGRGRYQPQTKEGQRLLAHELTHVIQQSGSGHGLQTASTLSDPGDRYEQEADAIADVVVRDAADPQGDEGAVLQNTNASLPITPLQPPAIQRNGNEEHASETKNQFAERVRARAASRLTQNITVLGQWRAYVNAMEVFQLRAQLLTTMVAGYATTASPTPAGRQRFEDLVGTHNEAERSFRGAELDIEASYRDRVGSFMDFLESRAVTGYITTPSITENLQVLAGDRQAQSLPQPMYAPPDQRYRAYADTIRRFRSGEIGGCQTCHEINYAWQRTAELWGSPLPRDDFWSEPSALRGSRQLGSPFLRSPTALGASDYQALLAFMENAGSTATPASQSTATSPPTATSSPVTATRATTGTPPNPFLPTIAIPQGVEVPPARTNLCGMLPDAEDSQRVPSLAAWGPNSALVADILARIDSVLTPLGPRGYRVLGRQNFDALYAMSPDNMQSVRDGIIERINNRIQQYRDLRADIQNGGTPYEELCPIVDELLPSTNDLVRWQVLQDVQRWQEQERSLLILELVLVGLSIIYPPSAVLTVPAGMALGLARVSLGMDQQRQGRQWSQGAGARIYSLSQEAEAPSLADRGRSNIRWGAIGFGLSALSSGLMIAHMVAEARATSQLLQMLENGAVITHAQYPGVALLARNGRLLMVTESGQVLGYGMIANGQISWTRLSVPFSPFAGAGGAGAGATGTSLVPYGSTSMTPFVSPPFGGSHLTPLGGSPLLSPEVFTPALAGQGVPLLTAGPQIRGLLPPGPQTLIVDAQSGYPTFLYDIVTRTPGASGVGIEPGNFILGYQGIHPNVPADLEMAQLIARNTPQWGQSYTIGEGGSRAVLPITQWPRVGELSDLSLAGMSAEDQLFWQSLPTLQSRYRMPPAAIDPTSVFPSSTTLTPSTTIPGAWEVQPLPFAIPSTGQVSVIPQPFFPTYGGLAPVDGPQGSGWSIMRPRLVPRGISDVAGITPTQHRELYNRVDQLYLRRPFGIGRASASETQSLGAELNQMLRPGGFVEFRLTRSDLLAPGQLQAIQNQIPGSTTVVIDQAAIDAFRASRTVPADATEAEMAILRAAETDIRQRFDPLGLARMVQIIRIYKPASVIARP